MFAIFADIKVPAAVRGAIFDALVAADLVVVRPQRIAFNTTDPARRSVDKALGASITPVVVSANVDSITALSGVGVSKDAEARGNIPSLEEEGCS
jgi:hypothetical protein